MAKRYRPVARDQAFLLPPDMRDWLPAGHPVWLVITVAGRHLDTSAVHALRRTGGAGTAGYDPDMMVSLLVWAYANRVTSPRRIEALCRTDIAFRVICAGDVPDHVTIARFRAGLGAAAGVLFDQVLILCARLGMGQLGLITLDGTRVAASASKSANRSEDGLPKLAAELAAEHAAADAAEDALFGPGIRGDEVPAELAGRGPGRGGSPRRWPIWKTSAGRPSSSGTRQRRPAWPPRRPGGASPRPGPGWPPRGNTSSASPPGSRRWPTPGTPARPRRSPRARAGCPARCPRRRSNQARSPAPALRWPRRTPPPGPGQSHPPAAARSATSPTRTRG